MLKFGFELIEFETNVEITLSIIDCSIRRKYDGSRSYIIPWLRYLHGPYTFHPTNVDFLNPVMFLYLDMLFHSLAMHFNYYFFVNTSMRLRKRWQTLINKLRKKKKALKNTSKEYEEQRKKVQDLEKDWNQSLRFINKP